MPAVNMLTYIQSLLDQGRFRNNPMVDRLPELTVPPGQVWTPNPAEQQTIMQAMGHRAAPSQAGLPDAVVRSIQQAPMYSEGEIIPNPRIAPNEMGPGGRPLDPSGRTGGNRLSNDLADWRNFLTLDQPLLEGMRPYTDRYDPGQSVYPSPLNQFMGRLPGMGLY
jgi:hypothetical protein